MFTRIFSTMLLAAGVFVSTGVHACNIKQSAHGELTLTVGSSGCQSSAAQVSKMAMALKSAVAAMESSGSSSRSGGSSGRDIIHRSSNAQKLYNIAAMNDQARFLSGQPRTTGYYSYPMKSK